MDYLSSTLNLQQQGYKGVFKMNINKLILSSFSVFMLSTVGAIGHSEQLIALTDSDLSEVNGQAGVDLALKMSLNHTSDYKFDNSVCANNKLEFCRLAISANNRYDDGSNDSYDATGQRVISTTGKKQWLVFKGIQGTINIDKLGLDGSDVTFKSKSGVDTYRGALNFSFDVNKPIKIRNLGFQSMSIETDSDVGVSNTNVEGFLNTAKYDKTTDSVFDKNNPDTGVAREKGFLGLSMNGNLSIGGNIKIFSCLDHSRC
ncbi:hypothetical protein CDG68_06725 [Acinetobacter wuhouensis]|uniref:Uncharacterized protein n=2 Tax=Acinetobacter wuhouensis TaxID=1879050 RepID=A0A3G2T0A1_9GAMM|nr:hypothetical protein CDG68_06725 [Acinetobacter wuhouensis]